MRTMQNPARDGHWASSSFPVFLAGILPDADYTIRVEGQIVGFVVGDLFVKRVKASQHFLHTPLAIAFDIYSLKDAIRAGACKVKIEELESGQVYQTLISTIWRKGFELDRGFGRQIALPLADWNRGDEPFGQQLGLWG